MRACLSVAVMLTSTVSTFAGQAPGAAEQLDIAVSEHDRFYTSDQFSNTVSVIDPATNKLLGVIRLGDQTPGNLSPLYRDQLLVHGMGFSPDHRTLSVVSIGSNAVSFVDTASNAVKHTTYVGRSPHEAFFTPDGKEVWVSVRGENYIAVLDGQTYREKSRIEVPNGPGMTIFSPDGIYGYVCSSFTPETVVIATASKQIVGRVQQESPFCPDIAATPDGKQVWFTLKDIGKVTIFNARPPFEIIKVFDTGPITNHVNFAHTPRGQFAYVTVGGLNLVKVFRTADFEQVTTIQTGALPHGLWPSGDGTRIYVGLENADAAAAIDTRENKVIATIPVGQAPQGVAYVPGAVPRGEGLDNLQPSGAAAQSTQLRLAPPGGRPMTQVTLFNQGLVEVLQAAVTGLEPKKPYVLALATQAHGGGKLEPIASFMTNQVGAAIVNSLGPIRQLVEVSTPETRRYLVIAPGSPDQPGQAVQVQMP
jgi:YVTN family beta-propeller protein